MLRVRRPKFIHRSIYLAAFLLALHYAFTLYINSTFLNQFFVARTISTLYTFGSALTLIGLIVSSVLIKKYGNTRLLLSGLVVEFIALLGLVIAAQPLLIGIFFIIHQALPPLLLFSLDISLESTMKSEATTGRVRSWYLTIINTAVLLSPLLAGILVASKSYRLVYLSSALFIFLLYVLTSTKLRTIRLRPLVEINFVHSLRHFLLRKKLPRIFFLNFLLQSFYALMVIYSPLYLHTTIGFGWQTIGILFTIMLLPFVLFQSALGHIFDRFHRENDTLIVGFLIMSASTCSMFLIHSTSVLAWATLLFISRIGASFVEVASEYAFFKRVTEQDAEFISMFRMTVPVSYIITPPLLSLILSGLSLRYVFIIISFIMMFGIVLSYGLMLKQPKAAWPQ